MIGKIFEGIYTVEAAEWCNANNAYIEEIEPINGVRRFEVKEVLPYVPPVETEEERQVRIAQLYLTAADVERAVYKVKGITFDDILEMDLQDVDKKALKIELKANHFYRGNPYVNAIGSLLGFTSEQLDNFFETNDYKALENN